MDDYRSQEHVIIFSEVPPLHALTCVMAVLDPLERCGKPVLSVYHWKILKSRILLFSNANQFLVSPSLNAPNEIYVISSKEFYDSGLLVRYLKEHKFKVGQQQCVTDEIYAACLRYSMKALLAPQWNPVDSYLVAGRNFLTSTKPVNAVKLDVVVTQGEMHMVFWPVRMILPRIIVKDLHDSPHVHDKEAIALDFSNAPPKIYILPNMTLGYVKTLTSTVPYNNHFNTYADLKKHWKNMYGYRLPDNDEGMLYASVAFGPNAKHTLTYPLLCLRSATPYLLRKVDTESVFNNFFTSLNERVPLICGHPFAVEHKLGYAVPKLNSADAVLKQRVNISYEQPPSSPMVLSGVPLVAIQAVRVNPVFVSSKAPVHTPNRPVQLQAPVKPQLKVPSFKPKVPNLIPFQPYKKPVLSPTLTTKPRVTTPIFRPTARGSGFSQASYPCSSSSFTTTPTLKPMFAHGQPTNANMALVKPDFRPTYTRTLYSSVRNNNNRKISLVPQMVIAEASQQPVDFTMPDTTSVSSNKRAGQPLLTKDGAGKRVRSKVQVQEHLDVEALAQIGELGRANTATLVAYLREHNVPCKVKDRKQQLVDKVTAYLNGTSVVEPSSESQNL